MRLSKNKISQETEKEILNQFFQVIADIKSPDEAMAFLEEILTKTEMEAIAKRLAVAHYLEKGHSYENIRETLKVSSATVASVAEQLKGNGGYQVALKKIQADQWAEKWAQKLNGMMGKKP
jgi:TrpR-related protein YerC/YecD